MFKLFLTKNTHMGVFMGVFALILITSSGFAQQHTLLPVATNGPPDAIDILTPSEEKILSNRQMAIRFAPIRSKEDLDSYLEASINTSNSFDSLSTLARQRFLDSLVFTPKGLSSFQTTDLKYELTPTEIYKILYLFGMQHLVPKMDGARIETRVDEVLMQKPQEPAIIRSTKTGDSPLKNDDGTEPISTIQLLCSTWGFDDDCGGNGDRDDYLCESLGTCRAALLYICTANC